MAYKLNNLFYSRKLADGASATCARKTTVQPRNIYSILFGATGTVCPTNSYIWYLSLMGEIK